MLASGRVFLFLQGPHGPFFSMLGEMLRRAGASVWRIGFNAGDQAFWNDKGSFVPYRDRLEEWSVKLDTLLGERGVTDIVLYGDTRPIHAQAIEAAEKRGIAVHVFEEGYLRPWWITYERGGSNGNSRLMKMDVAEMRQALDQFGTDGPPPPPAHWGDMRQHIFYGAFYHWFVMFLNKKYRNFRPHRALQVSEEFQLYFKRLMLMPLHRIERFLATARIQRGGFPYHLVLLQLEHDSSFQCHSDFSCMTEFLDQVIAGFAAGAPGHHHLVIKEHPLENHRVPLRHEVRRLGREYGVAGRVHYLPGGKLARLLDDANTAVTINSTAGQQVLWRGKPLRVFGRSVYAKPEFVSLQPISEFFAQPRQPDNRAYRDYRRFLLETSQVPGGFYSRRGRRQLLRHVVDMMLNVQDPYEALSTTTESRRQQLRLLRQNLGQTLESRTGTG